MSLIPITERLTQKANIVNTITSSLINRFPLTSRMTYRVGGKRKEYSIEYKDYGEKSNYYAHQKAYMFNYLKSKYRLQEEQAMKQTTYCNKKSKDIMMQKTKNYQLKQNKIKDNSINNTINNNLTFNPDETKKSSNKTKTISTERTIAFVNNQIEWFKSVKKKNDNLITIQKAVEEMEYFQLTKRSIENKAKRANSIILAKSFIKKKYNTKLRKELNKKELELTFTPKTNNLYLKKVNCISENYSPNKTQTSKLIKKSKINGNFSKKANKNNSYDNSFYNNNKKKIIDSHWIGELKKLNVDRKNSITKSEYNERIYKININDKGAWNENCVNTVRLNKRTKDVLLSLLS